MNELPTEELKVILLHELAHLRRWDDWTNLAQKIVSALFFFHPAVWWIEGRLTLEREMACDDLVLAQTTSPKTYAKSLLSLAERVGMGKGIALAQAALGRAHETTLRIMQILDAGRPKATRVWKPALGLVTAMSAVAILAVPYTPNLVAFENPSPMITASANHIGPIGPLPVIHVVPVKQVILPVRHNFVAQAKPRQRNPLAVQAKLNQPAQMMVVMRTVEYDESGVAVWTLCVWQVTETKTNHKQLHPELATKSL